MSPPSQPLREADVARELAECSADDSRPRTPLVHLLDRSERPRLYVPNGSRIYDVSSGIAARVRTAIEANDEAELERMLVVLGIDSPPYIDDRPLVGPPLHALSLAVAQKCNLGCTYCYARQGTFGGEPKSMSGETARRAIDLLLDGRQPGDRVTVAFLGGEPLTNRPVIQDATEYAVERAAARGVNVRFSITTNGTLLTEDDGRFFEDHGFAVTISLDGLGATHDRLRPFRGGAGSYDQIITRVAPLLALQRKMQVSARVTVTPYNMDLPAALDEMLSLGFHGVGFSPLLRSSSGLDELDAEGLRKMLEGMIACGLSFERHVLNGERYAFLNMTNAMHELHRGTHRPYPCGAGAGYLGVSADGDLAACHRFVGDEVGAMGTLTAGVDATLQNEWLAERHVHRQEPCRACWARYLCGGGCHHEVIEKGRPACDYIRGWLHYAIEAHGRLVRFVPNWFDAEQPTVPEQLAGSSTA